ncbi:MAG: immunoglobulin domain-containing protein [Chloroflexota bacterium]
MLNIFKSRIRAIKLCLSAAALSAIIWGATPQPAKADYCSPVFDNGCLYDDYISSFWIKEGSTELVAITGLSCGSGGEGPGYQDISKPTILLGSQYAWSCNLEFTSQAVKIWVDWDDDGGFEEKGDYITGKFITGASGGGDITFPESGKKGTHRVMVVNCYYETSLEFSACTQNEYSFGAWLSFDAEFAPKVPDAAITAITFPPAPYVEGSYIIKATLKNANSKVDLTEANIHWAVNGAEQPSIYWNGKLTPLESEEINLGYYNLSFGPNGPWDPFDFLVWVTNANGLADGESDDDPSNDSKTGKTSPAMDDAGAVQILPPIAKFGPGTQDVYVRIKNYSRKPMTSVKIPWTVDGVAQTTRTWFGTLLKDQTADFNIGSYNFQFKTPLRSYTIEAQTQDPNGKADEWTKNDAATPREMAPALVPGTYTVGDRTSHFEMLEDMGSYVSTNGIYGAGDVTFNIKPGKYVDQVRIENTDPANRIFLRSATGNSNDVIWQPDPDPGQPYAIALSNAYNINISSIDFRPMLLSGGCSPMIVGSGVTGVTLSKNIFNGVAGYTANCSMVALENSSKIEIQANQFINGSYQLYASNSSSQPVDIVVKDNLFSGFTRQAVMLEANSSTPNDKIEITKNTVMNNKLNRARTAFEVRGHSAKITYNTLENLAAVHSPGDVNAGIKVMAGDAGKTEINNNEINNLENVNGIYVTGQNADIRKNKILLSSSADGIYGAGINFAGGKILAAYNEIVVNASKVSDEMNGIQLAAATGYIADNTVVGNNINGALNNGVNGVTYIYNTFNIRCNANKAIQVNGGSANLSRNIFVNRGLGNAFNYAAPTIITGVQNNFYSYGANPDDLIRWKKLTDDPTSTDMKITFNEESGTRLGRYIDEIVYKTPLALPSDIDADLQKVDFLGNPRDGFWYAGANGMNLSIAIIEQPKDLLECEGAKNLIMKVVAQVTGGAETYFQWYKDGAPIQGETKSVYRIPVLTKDNTGVYRCHVWGPANVAAGLDTKDLVVYTLGKTSIVRQDEEVMAGYGENATLEAEAHIKGITAPFFQQRYQWYKRMAGAPDIKLADGEKYVGANTPKLFIKNVQGEDYYYGSLGYVLEVEGQCGKVFTKPINLVPKPGIVFNKQNDEVDRCSGAEPAVWEVDLNYFGKFGQLIVEHITDNPNNPKYGFKETIDFSTTTPQNYTWGFAIANPTSADNQTQKTRVTMLPGGQVWESQPVSWKFHDAPNITTQPQAVTVEEEKEFALTAEASSDKPATYQWYKDGQKIDAATDKTYYVASAATTDQGQYKAEVTNECGATFTDEVMVTVTPKGINSASDGLGRDGIISLAPNPVSEILEIGFVSSKAGRASFKILETSGREVMSFEAEAASEKRFVRQNVSRLGSGSYIIVMESGGSRFVERFVVVK